MYDYLIDPRPPTHTLLTQGKEPDYLDYNIKGRSWWERTPYNAGALYLTGENFDSVFFLAATGASVDIHRCAQNAWLGVFP